jgi:hypothetical protein
MVGVTMSAFDTAFVYSRQKNYQQRQDIYDAQVYQQNTDSIGEKSNPKPASLKVFAPASANVTQKILTEEYNLCNISTHVYETYKLSFGPIYTIDFERKNSNIYKNIFPEEVFDYGPFIELQGNVETTTSDIVQEAHGFIKGNVIAYKNGKYVKALAEKTLETVPIGIVSNVISSNVFTLMTTGIFEWKTYSYDDTSILYLSDIIPGILVHYDQIKSNVFIPVASYIDNKQILLNIQTPTVGAPMAPYEQYSSNFENYTQDELDEIIQYAISGVNSDER